MLVNRLHAFPIRASHLRRFRTLHDLAVPTYPLALAALSHFHPPNLAATLQFSRFPEPLQLLVLLTSAFSIPLAAGILRWQVSGKHRFHDATRKQLVNLHKQAANLSPAAADAVAGIPKRLAKLWPWNEFLQLELNHKTLHVPSSSTSPNQLPTLRILHLSDLHFTGTPGLEFYRRVVELALQQPTDAVMFTGDLIDDPQLLPAAVEILKPLTQIAPCWFVLGNHDWRYNHELIRQTLEDSGWQSAAGRQIPAQIRGLNLLIAGSERPWMSTPPQDARHTPADLRILLCHTPDGLANARKLGYQIVLAGHTHGGQVVLPVIGPVYSPSSHGVKFASGLFQFPDSTLHVSRGVGSKDPLRWNCTPELTWLHVQPAHHTQPQSPIAD